MTPTRILSGVRDMRVTTMGQKAFLLASAASFMLVGHAWAQDDDLGPEEEQAVDSVDEVSPRVRERRTEADEIVVTGSRLRRDTFNSVAPLEVITAEEATLEGLIDTASIIQGSAVASGSVQLNNQFGGFVVDGGTGINSISLRGLGAQRSLVLLNGRRPGPSGTRGAVGSFDLNNVPQSIVQRAEILKDGAGSIYGSDAVAGVVNIITLTQIDEPVLTVSANVPKADGGATYSVNGAFGINRFDNGSIAVAGQYDFLEDLSLGDRDYLSCPSNLLSDPITGESRNREDRSVLRNDVNLGGCDAGPIYFNTVIDAFTGERYVPSPDGVTIGPIPGYRPRQNANFNPETGENAFFEDVLNDYRALEEDAINQTERASLYLVSDFEFDALGGVKWLTELLYTRRETRSEGIRQFFPFVGGPAGAPFGLGYANDPDFENPFGVARPVLIHPSNSEVAVDFFNAATELSGEFGGSGFFSDWNWAGYATYSYSDGSYTNEDQIFQDVSGDAEFDDDAPVFDYFSPEILSGFYPDGYFETIGGDITGNTTYEQVVLNAFVSGPVFELPAGEVLVALGGEFRDFSIDDQPDEQAQAGNLWGFSSAQVTKGSDSVIEAFGEIEVPILAGVAGIEELTFSGSGRVFDYDSTGSDGVYKVALNWQTIPSVRLRSTLGTSYRSPALFELFLGDQTAFAGQLGIDPCINYGLEATNENIIRNCAAEGIPPDYDAGTASSATIISGGGADILVPETSDALTFGVVLTPEFLPLSLAVDYFEIEVKDQISQLGAGAIVFGCYGADSFPNAFCDLIDRGTAASEFAIDTVQNSYVNINTQESRGIDASLRYDQDFDFGRLVVNSNFTWTLEDTFQAFDPEADAGFDTTDFNGTIGDPTVVGNAQASFTRGDWTYSWFSDFVGTTSNTVLGDPIGTAFGAPVQRINGTEAIWYHDASVRWEGEKTTILAGVQNLFDEEPPFISGGVPGAARRGNVPLSGTQYDLRGRTFFVRLTQEF